MADNPDEKPVLVSIPDGARGEVQERREPPVVARLVIEIRSDGTHTIARGKLQDAAAGQEVAIQAEGTTPLALALSLVKSMLRAPSLGKAFGGALRALTPGRPRRKDGGRG